LPVPDQAVLAADPIGKAQAAGAACRIVAARSFDGDHAR
jgi:hypothetical protein